MWSVHWLNLRCCNILKRSVGHYQRDDNISSDDVGPLTDASVVCFDPWRRVCDQWLASVDQLSLFCWTLWWQLHVPSINCRTFRPWCRRVGRVYCCMYAVTSNGGAFSGCVIKDAARQSTVWLITKEWSYFSAKTDSSTTQLEWFLIDLHVHTRDSSGDEIPDRDIILYFATLLRLTPRRRNFPGTISVKFCTEVKGWLRYKMAKKYCRKFQRPD